LFPPIQLFIWSVLFLVVIVAGGCRSGDSGVPEPAASPSLTPTLSEAQLLASRPPPIVVTGAATEPATTALVAEPTNTPVATPIILATEPAATATQPPPPTETATNIVGTSYGGRPIGRYTFGDGPLNLAFVGALHGGYEWNTANLAYEMLAYFEADPAAVPDAITLHIIPVANPDGLARVDPSWTDGPIPPPGGVLTDTLPGRFNGRDVDLNRNWDCNWSSDAFWRAIPVNAGLRPFSEPETVALRDYFLAEEMRAVVFWHSAAGSVLPGRCGDSPHAPSTELAAVYRRAAAYPVRPGGLPYAITGDASDWLTTQGIASIAIELTDHTTIEFERNLAGVLAVLDYYAAVCAGEGCLPE
jgi:hypothetical protein